MEFIKSDSLGGSELTARMLLTKIDLHLLDGVNLILNSTDERLLRGEKINVLWNQHNTDQPSIQNMASKDFQGKIDCFVYVSHWQYERYRRVFDTPPHKSIVIRNAIDEFPATKKPEKITLIYTSTPWRGLDVLLDSFEMLRRNDVELHIYSSTKIYGSKFDHQNSSKYQYLFDRATQMEGVKYFGYASNQDVRNALTDSHIFSYPSTWEETSCMSAIEAGMAGLNLVVTNLGALYDTCGAFGHYVCSDSSRKSLVLKYTHALNRVIDNFWSDDNQQNLKDQQCYFNRFYGWTKRISEWQGLLGQLQAKRKIRFP